MHNHKEQLSKNEAHLLPCQQVLICILSSECVFFLIGRGGGGGGSVGLSPARVWAGAWLGPIHPTIDHRSVVGAKTGTGVHSWFSTVVFDRGFRGWTSLRSCHYWRQSSETIFCTAHRRACKTLSHQGFPYLVMQRPPIGHQLLPSPRAHARQGKIGAGTPLRGRRTEGLSGCKSGYGWLKPWLTVTRAA